MKTFIAATLMVVSLMAVGGCRVTAYGPVHPHHHHHGPYHHGHYGHPMVDEIAQWQILGSTVVTSSDNNVAVIETSGSQGPFLGILLKVEESDLELTGVKVTFEGGEEFKPSINHFFTEGSRSCTIDFPVGEPRKVSSVEITVVKLPENALAKIELYAR